MLTRLVVLVTAALMLAGSVNMAEAGGRRHGFGYGSAHGHGYDSPRLVYGALPGAAGRMTPGRRAASRL